MLDDHVQEHTSTYLRELKTYIHTKTYKNVHSSFSHSCKKGGNDPNVQQLKNEQTVLMHATTWMHLENITQRERSQTHSV